MSKFDGLNTGDIVRVDFVDGALEGHYSSTTDHRYDVPIHRVNPSSIDTRFMQWFYPDDEQFIAQVTVLERAIPPEPRYGSVVLDKRSVAWQRETFNWRTGTVGYDTPVADWEYLQQCGPLTIIYTPEES